MSFFGCIVDVVALVAMLGGLVLLGQGILAVGAAIRAYRVFRRERWTTAGELLIGALLLSPPAVLWWWRAAFHVLREIAGEL